MDLRQKDYFWAGKFSSRRVAHENLFFYKRLLCDYCSDYCATTVRLLCDYCVNTARIRRATVFNGKTQWPSTADTLRCNMDPRREYAPPRVAQTVDGKYFASRACTGQGTATTPHAQITPDQASFDIFNPAPRISMLASTPARRLAKFFHLDAMRFAAW